MWREFDSHRDHIWYSGGCAGDIMNGYDSVLLGTVRGEGIAPEIPVTKSVILINELDNM